MKSSLLQRINRFLSASDRSADTTRLHVTGAQGDRITFVSDRKHRVHQRVTIAMTIQHDRLNATESLILRSRVIACRRIPQTSREEGSPEWEYTGDISGAPLHMRYLLERMFVDCDLSNGASSVQQKFYPRQAERHQTCFQVLSPDQRFKALALDLSTSGIRLRTDQPIEPGTHLKLTLDIPVGYRPTLDCMAEAIWTKPESDRPGYKNGLRFLNLSRGQVNHLERYLASLTTWAGVGA